MDGENGVSYSNFVNEDGSFAENWTELAPEEFRGENSLKAIPDFPTMVKNYVNAQKFIGTDKIAIPGKNAKPEDWDAVYNKLGRPEKPEHYGELKPPDTMPKDFPLDTEMVNEFRGVAHKIGLLPSQVKGLYDWFMDKEIKHYGTYEEMVSKESTELQNAISDNPHERDQLKKKATDVFSLFADDRTTKLAERTGLFNNPAFVLVMNQVSGKFSEETMKNLKPGGGGDSRTGIQEKINEIIQGGQDTPFYNRKDPKHRETVAYVESLYKQLSPE